MQIFAPLSKADDFILVQQQRAYLAVLDYTGIYVASIMSALSTLSIGVAVLTHNWVDAGLMGFWGLIVCPIRWHLQHNSETGYNAHARLFMEAIIRRPFLCVILFVLIPLQAIPPTSISSVGLQAVFFLNTYLQCIMVRKREPKTFFKPVGTLALQGIQ